MAWQIRQCPLFPVSILQKQRQIYLLFQKSLKNDCSNLYFYLYNFNKSYKFFAYLTSLSRRGPVNQSTSTFGNINLTETATNLIVAWKFSQKWQQESLFAP